MPSDYALHPEVAATYENKYRTGYYTTAFLRPSFWEIRRCDNDGWLATKAKDGKINHLFKKNTINLSNNIL
jgi:hypothetical protein